MGINNVTFPLPKEWLAEFKADWYKDNNSLPKKKLNELWAETERVCYMVYKYQRKVFEKNLAALQPSTLPLIEDDKYIFPGDYWLKYVSQFEKLKEVWEIIPEPINILLRQQIDIFAGKYPFKSVPLIDKGEPEAIEKYLPPDHGEICWETGSETFTRKEVYYLLWTQRSMIINDLKSYAGESLTPNILDVLDNPRIPKY